MKGLTQGRKVRCPRTVKNVEKLLISSFLSLLLILEQKTEYFLKELFIFRAIWEDPIEVQLRNDDQLHTMPIPGSGLLLGFILSILDGYNFNKTHIEDIDSTILTYHRIIEAFKYAYAKRTELGDTRFNNLTDVNLLTYL